MPCRAGLILVYAIALSSIAGLFTSFAVAAEEQASTRAASEARAKAVAPFLGDQWLSVVHADVARLKIDTFFSQFVDPLFGDRGGQQAADQRKKMLEFVEAFLKTGAKDVYIINNGRPPLEPQPFALIPLSGDVNEEALKKLLQEAKIESVARMNDMLFAGTTASLTRVQALKPTEYPALVDAFDAAGDTAAQIMFIPTPQDLKEVEQTAPALLPPRAGGGPTAPLFRGFSWLAAGIDGPPNLSARLVIKSPDTKSAGEFYAAIKDVYDAAISSPDRGPGQALPMLAAFVKVDRADTELRVSFDGGPLATMLGLFQGFARGGRQGGLRSASNDQLKQLALAIQTHAQEKKTYPAAFTADNASKPLLSWRVQILPYIGEQDLYDQFRQNEPWDSDHNKALIAKMPKVFACPGSSASADGRTVYLAPRGGDTVFPGAQTVAAEDVRDGLSKTILLLEVDESRAVEWTRPDDFEIDGQNPTAGFGGHFGGKFQAVLCDGSVHALDLKIDPELFKALLTRAGGEQIEGP